MDIFSDSIWSSLIKKENRNHKNSPVKTAFHIENYITLVHIMQFKFLI